MKLPRIFKKQSPAYSNRLSDPGHQTPGGANAHIQQRKKPVSPPHPKSTKSPTAQSTDKPTTTPTTKAKRSRTPRKRSLQRGGINPQSRLQAEEITRSMGRYFGFCADPAKSSLHNTRSHRASHMVLSTDAEERRVPQALRSPHTTAQPTSPSRTRIVFLSRLTNQDLWHPCPCHRSYPPGCPP
jgi:hypothetical protein